MDTSDLPNHEGNGSVPPQGQTPSTDAVPKGAPVESSNPVEASAGAPAVPLVVVDNDVRDEKGRMRPGKTLNPKGRPPGIPNKNVEFLRLLNAKELREVWKIAKARAREGKVELLEFLLERALIKVTPESAGIVINNHPSAHAAASANQETHVNVAKLIADGKGREAVAGIAERLAACGAFPGRNGDAN